VHFQIKFSGHKNIRSLHPKTIEITKDSHLTSRGDCIVGVNATCGCKDIPSILKKKLKDPNSTIKFSNMLGDVMKGSTVSTNSLSITDNNSTETYAILEEAHNIIEGRAKASIPEVPSELKEEVELKKEAFI